MTARDPRFEVVRTDAGWHARFIAANGQTVWTTESYTRRRPAIRAIDSLALSIYAGSLAPWRDVDERTKP